MTMSRSSTERSSSLGALALVFATVTGCSDSSVERPEASTRAAEAPPRALTPADLVETFALGNERLAYLVKSADGPAAARRAFQENRADVERKWEPLTRLREGELTDDLSRRLEETIRSAASTICAVDDPELCASYTGLLTRAGR